MNITAQKIAIAESVGWVRTDPRPGKNVRPFWTKQRLDPNLLVQDPDDLEFAWEEDLPPYALDERLIRDAVRGLPPARRGLYLTKLADLVGRTDMSDLATITWLMTTATPGQQVEAYLKALNLWRSD